MKSEKINFDISTSLPEIGLGKGSINPNDLFNIINSKGISDFKLGNFDTTTETSLPKIKPASFTIGGNQYFISLGGRPAGTPRNENPTITLKLTKNIGSTPTRQKPKDL